MITELLEIVFENIPIKKIVELLSTFIKANDNIASYHIIDNGEVSFDEEEITINFESLNDIVTFFEKKYTHIIVININRLYFNSKDYLMNCSINIREVSDNIFSLEVNFSSNETSYSSAKKLCNALMDFSYNIASQYKVKNYYCGLEPAEMLEGRLFTGTNWGCYYNEFILS